MVTRYFKTDSRKLTFRECWNLAPGLGKVVLIGAKVLGIELKLSRGAPMTDRAQVGQIAFEEIAPEARQPIATAVARMEALGFHSPQFTTGKHSLLQGVYAVVVSMLHRSCEMIGGVAYSRATLVHPPQEKLHFGIETWLADGRNLTTTTGPPAFQPIAGSENLHLTGRAVEEAF